MKQLLRIGIVIALIALAAGLFTIHGSAAGDTSLTGVLGITWGDSPQGDGTPPRIDLYDADGNDYLLEIDPAVSAAAGGLLSLNGTRVTVQGDFDVNALNQGGATAFVVSDIVTTGEASALGTVTGSKPWVIIMCKFADYAAAPKDQGYFQGLFGSTFPGINDFWQRISYGAVNLNGTTVMATWVVLPHSRSYYIGSSANLQALTTDCTGLVDASVNFSQFSGVSMMFNAELDGMAWGGTTYLNRDGVGIIRATWMPPWGYENQNVLAHEVGHGFGLPHSSGPYNQTYDSPWDVMSSWPPCNGHSDPNYGCIGVETISFHRNLLGWIPSSRIYTAGQGSNGQITLERLGQPTNPAGSYLMAIIPIPGSSSRFYTVEARKYIDSTQYNDYEEELIGQAVVIHLVDTTRSDRLAQVVDGDNNGNPKDAGTMWTPGETYADAAHSIYVSVLSDTATGYVVNIRSGTTPNDGITTPTVISAFPYTNNLNTPTATSDPSDPVFPCASTKGGATVWYKFTPGAPGPVQVSTVGSNYDTILAIWTGTVGSLTNVACNDDGGGSGTSSVSADLTAGTAYYVEVGAKSSAGNLNFNLSFTPCFSLSTSASPAGWGTVSASPDPNCYGAYYSNGTTVQLTATPGAGTTLGSWSGALSGSASPATLVMSANRSVTAKFLPAAPTLLSPVGGSSTNTRRPLLDWSDVSSASYQVQISKSATLSSPSTYSTGGSSLTVPVDLAIYTKYFWHVRSYRSGTYGAWSEIGTFVTPNPPSVPTLASPGNGKTVATNTPLLDWNDATNSPSGYQLQVSADKGFASPVIDATSASSSYAVSSPLSFNTRFYWHVRAFNALNQYSGWSATYSFGTLAGPPTLVLPIGGATVDNLRPRFDWDPPAGGAKSYTLQIAWDAGFAHTIKTTTISATEFSPSSDLPRNTLLYWRVLSTGTFGKSPWSSTESLQSPNPPTTPSLLQPASSTASPSYRPSFDWSDSLTPPGTDPLPYTNAIGYQLQVSSATTFASPVIDTAVSVSTYTPSSNLAIGVYYWRVRAFNSLNQYSNWSSAYRFYTPGGISGSVLDAMTGNPVSGATVGIVGTSLSTTTDAAGSYTLTGIPGGSRSLSIGSNGRVTLVSQINVPNGAMTHFSAAQVSSGAPSSEYRMVLFWENGPTDLDLHLWLPSTTPSHLRWDSLGSIASFPSAALSRDSSVPYGVETIRIAQLYGGTYTLGVYNYSNNASLKSARATVWVYQGDTVVKIVRSPGSGSYRWWRVLYLYSTGNISISSRLVSSAPGSYDRSGGTGPK